jgi:hypothetical protein
MLKHCAYDDAACPTKKLLAGWAVRRRSALDCVLWKACAMKENG